MNSIICFLAIILTVNGQGYYGRPSCCDYPYRMNYPRRQEYWPPYPDYEPYPMVGDSSLYHPYNDNDNAHFPHPVDATPAPDTNERYYPITCDDDGRSNGLSGDELNDYIRNNRHPGPVTDENEGDVHANQEESRVCRLPMKVGPCRASFKRYFYDNKDRVCKNFIYGGCEGNANNFMSLEECEHKCMQK